MKYKINSICAFFDIVKDVADVCFGCGGECGDPSCSSKRSSKGSNADVESNAESNREAASPVTEFAPPSPLVTRAHHVLAGRYREMQAGVHVDRLQGVAAVTTQQGGECDENDTADMGRSHHDHVEAAIMGDDKKSRGSGYHVVFKELPSSVEAIYIGEDSNQNMITSTEDVVMDMREGVYRNSFHLSSGDSAFNDDSLSVKSDERHNEDSENANNNNHESIMSTPVTSPTTQKRKTSDKAGINNSMGRWIPPQGMPSPTPSVHGPKPSARSPNRSSRLMRSNRAKRLHSGSTSDDCRHDAAHDMMTSSDDEHMMMPPPNAFQQPVLGYVCFGPSVFGA